MASSMQSAQREDDGLFAPDSIVRRVFDHPAAVAYGAYREALMAAVGPKSSHAIHTQSRYQSDPVGRIKRTTTFATAVIFGTTAQAEHASAVVRRRHAHVRGVEPVTGERYSLKAPFTGPARDRDRELFLSGYVIIMESVVVAYDMFCQRLSAAEHDRYWQEMVPMAGQLGLEPEDVPTNRDSVDAFYRTITPELALTPDGKQLYQDLVDVTRLDRKLWPALPAQTLFAAQTLTTIPDTFRTLMPSLIPKRLDPLLIASARATAHAMTLAPARRATERLLQTEHSQQILTAERASRQPNRSRQSPDAVKLAA
jgi:uncharacterized protein (DUF2236 family)